MPKVLKLLAGERRPNESGRAVQGCNDYLRLGPGRSLQKLYSRYTKAHRKEPPTDSLQTLKNWSTEFEWQKRASEYDAAIEEAKNEKRRKSLEEGLALEYERVNKLKRLARYLESQIFEKDDDGNHLNVWVADVKQIGGGEFAERVDLVRFNSALISEYRSTLDDLAKEVGDRRQKLDHQIEQIDYSKLSDTQLESIANGEDPHKVVLSGYIASRESES
jgi:hypothetical protein